MITLTETAHAKAQSAISSRQGTIGLRVGVKTTGCSGMAYVLEFVDSLGEWDKVFDNNGVKIIVDEKSLVYLEGLEMDYTKKGLNEGFEFINPNATGECGCGESFTVK